MEWIIDGDRPIWMQLQDQLSMRIISGKYPMGGRLPSVRELAAEAGVNPNTMQRALGAVEARGLVVTNRTAGRYVTEDQNLIREIRMELARRCMEEYLQGMKTLGFSEDEARHLLLEG